jgi:hypothetical protein
MTETLPAGESQPPLPAQTGGAETADLGPASFSQSPEERAADGWRCETNPESQP